MKKYLIATHSNMAKGVFETINFILGEQDNLNYYCAYTERNDIPIEDIEKYTDINEDDQLIIFTDIYTGSVTQHFYKYLDNPNIFLITGINIPAIMSIMLSGEEKLNTQIIDDLLEEPRNQLSQIQQKVTNIQEDDE